jgi:hypothetical protein
MGKKRKFDLTPISYEEAAESPALKGMLSFLEAPAGARPGLDFRRERGAEPFKDTETTKGSVTEKGTDIQEGTVPLRWEAPAKTVIRHPGGAKLHYCLTARDGHSLAEENLYQSLWNSAAAREETPETRLITIGWDVMAALARTTPRLARENCFRLIEKLALERVAPPDPDRRIGTTYRVYSAQAVLARRRRAGKNWVVRNRGVRFVDPAAAQ